MDDCNKLKCLALEIRIATMEQFLARGFGHIGGSLSICDVLAVLYGDVMRYRPDDPLWPGRDKLVVSKGHAGPAVYAALALSGFFDRSMLKTLNQPGTSLPSHCDSRLTPGVDITTGSLGQGTSLAAGLAFGDRLKGRDCKTYLIVGDGELNEGQCWEAAMFSAHRRLDNLFWFVDWNKRQLDSWTEEVSMPLDLAEKFRSFGFDVTLVNGHDVAQLKAAIERASRVPGKPHCILMDTVKGYGVQEIEAVEYNHSLSPDAQTCQRWISMLADELKALQGGVSQ